MRQTFFFIRCFIGLTLFGAWAAQGSLSFFPKENDAPLRLPLLRLSPSYDAIKPLGVADYAGWVVAGKSIIGTIEDGWVGALSLPHLKPLWWVKDKRSPLSAPIFFGGDFVVLGFHDGELRKIDVHTGESIWKSKVMLDSFLARKIALLDGNLLAVSAAQTLYRINLETGNIDWVYEAGYPNSISIRNLSAPVHHKGTVYFGLAGGEIAAVHYQTGAFVWRRNPYALQSRFSDFVGEMGIYENTLVFSRSDGLVLGISLSTSSVSVEQKWVEAIRLPSISTSSLYQGTYYVGATSGQITAIEASTGQKLWEQTTARGPLHILGGENSLYAITAEGVVSALDPNKLGAVKWQDDLRANVYAPPVFIGTDFYVPTSYRVLYGYK